MKEEKTYKIINFKSNVIWCIYYFLLKVFGGDMHLNTGRSIHGKYK